VKSILYHNDDFRNILGNSPTLSLGMCEPSENTPMELLTIGAKQSCLDGLLMKSGIQTSNYT